MELRDSSFGVGFQFGILYELTPMTRLGLTYTSSTTSNFSSTPESGYNDIWAASAGMNWPLNEKWTLRFGAAYASSGVDTANRSFAFRLDRVIGAGAGAEYRWGKSRVLGANLTYFDLGSAPVNATIPLVGTLSGQYSSNYAIGIDLTPRWIIR